jgi:hypothetical protein
MKYERRGGKCDLPREHTATLVREHSLLLVGGRQSHERPAIKGLASQVLIISKDANAAAHRLSRVLVVAWYQLAQEAGWGVGWAFRRTGGWTSGSPRVERQPEPHVSSAPIGGFFSRRNARSQTLNDIIIGDETHGCVSFCRRCTAPTVCPPPPPPHPHPTLRPTKATTHQ